MSVIKNCTWILGRTRVNRTFEFHTSRGLSNNISQTTSGSTVDQQEVHQHAKMVQEWWHLHGPMKALHSYNLLRVPFIRDGLVNTSHYHRNLLPLRGRKILDVGCGGGILTEPLARLGAKVTGIDASNVLVNMAQEHSNKNYTLDFSRPNYICTTIEEHAESHQEEYDGVVCSEIIEHVTNKELFVRSCVDTLKLNGRIFFTTPNRSRLSQFGVIFLAENIFKLVPKGTHQIEKFITPNELQFMLERNKCFVELTHGVMYNPLTNRWSWSSTQAFAFALQAVKIQK